MSGKLFGWSKKVSQLSAEFKSCFNAYVLSSVEYCAPVWMSSAESHLGLLDSVVRSVEKLCEGELFCLEHRRKVTDLRLLYKIHHSVNHPMNEYLHHFVAVRNTRSSVALVELALVIPHCRTDQFSWSFLPAVVRPGNLFPSSVNVVAP